MSRMAGVAAGINALELWTLRDVLGARGVWRADTLAAEWGSARVVLAGRGFAALLALQLVAALGLAFGARGMPALASLSAVALLATTLLSAVRFRGNVNGGSDGMLFTVLGGLALAHWPNASLPVREAGVLYVAAQLTLSYVRAGLVKLRSPEWWNGASLAAFLALPAYNVPRTLLRTLPRGEGVLRAAGIATLLFEVAAPLAWVHPALCTAYIVTALCFHVGVAYVFGLNRFFWAWGAALPSLWYAMVRVHA